MVRLAIAAAVLIGAGLFLGMRMTSQPGAGHVVVSVIADGATGGPKVISTHVLPLR